MKAIRVLLFLFILVAAALSVSCNPVSPSNHPGSPPANNSIRVETKRSETADQATSNNAPRKYGIPYLLEHARNQAGQVGPNASLGISEDQLRFSTSAGRNQIHSSKVESKRPTVSHHE